MLLSVVCVLAVVVAALLAPVIESSTRCSKSPCGATSWTAPVVAALVALCVALPLRAAPPASPAVLILLAPSHAGSQPLPPVESFAQRPTAEADVAGDVAEAVVTETPLEAEQAERQAEKSLSQLEAELEAELQSPSRDVAPATTPPRIVELPADFVPPDQPVILPDDLPEWVDDGPKKEGENSLIPVSTTVEMKEQSTKSSLDKELVAATNQYIRDYLGNPRASYFVNYTPEDIRRRLIDGDKLIAYPVKTRYGPMWRSQAVLKFSPEFRAELDAKWAKVVQATRVLSTAGVGLAVLVALGMLFGYFRLDTATKGYYTGRLQMALVGAILALVAVGFVYYRSTAQWVYWLIM